MWWVPASENFCPANPSLCFFLLEIRSHSCLASLLLFLLFLPLLASCFPNILPSLSPSLPVCCSSCSCCCVSDSFCGPSPYSSAPLFQSEPPALAGLFRGRCTEVNRGVEYPLAGRNMMLVMLPLLCSSMCQMDIKAFEYLQSSYVINLQKSF